MRIILTTALTVIFLLAGIASAQPRRPMPRPGPRPGAMIERLNRMTPEQRERALNRLPADRRAKVKERLERLNAMPPKARERLREQYEEFQKLSPEKQDAFRRAFRGLNQLPADRKLMIRREVMRVRNMTPEDRNSHLGSENFHALYDDVERQLIRDLADPIPPPDTYR